MVRVEGAIYKRDVRLVRVCGVGGAGGGKWWVVRVVVFMEVDGVRWMECVRTAQTCSNRCSRSQGEMTFMNSSYSISLTSV